MEGVLADEWLCGRPRPTTALCVSPMCVSVCVKEAYWVGASSETDSSLIDKVWLPLVCFMAQDETVPLGERRRERDLQTRRQISTDKSTQTDSEHTRTHSVTCRLARLAP